MDSETLLDLELEKLIRHYQQNKIRPQVTFYQAIKGLIMATRFGGSFWPEEKGLFDKVYARRREWFYHEDP
jgi:hypothetical protein